MPDHSERATSSSAATGESNDEWAARVSQATVRRWRHSKTEGVAYPARGTITQVASCEWCAGQITSARHPVTVWVHADTGRVSCDA